MKDKNINEEKNIQNVKDDNIEFLRYLREVEKFPLEVESLKTSIESNKSTVRLADESIGHFSKTRADNKWTLWATLGVSFLTLSILIVQTLTVSKTHLDNPILFDSGQVNSYFQNQKKNTYDITNQLDSLKLEIQNLTNTLNLTIQNIKIHEKSDSTTNR